MDDKGFRRWNEGMFSKYGNERLYYHPNPLVRYIEHKRVSKIVEMVGKTASVLEVGCGEGYVLRLLRAERKYGIDISAKALEIAERKTEAELGLADAENLPFPDACFDSAVCTEVLEHTRNPAKVVAECLRVVKNGGRVVLSIPNERRINRLKDLVLKLRLFWLFPGIPKRMDSEWHIHSFDMGLLESIIPEKQVKEVVQIPALLSLRYVVVLESRHRKAPSGIAYFCPDCKVELKGAGKKLSCKRCKRNFGSPRGFPELLPKGFV